MTRDSRAMDEAQHWLKRAPLLTGIGATALAVVAGFGDFAPTLVISGFGLGTVIMILAVASWRWYRFWYSWLLWAFPIAVGCAILLRVFGASGILSFPSVMLQLMASMGTGFALLMWLGRPWVLRALS